MTTPSSKVGTKPPYVFDPKKQKKDLESFAANLQEAIHDCLSSHEKPYKNVAVFAFHWADDTMGVAGLETELMEVFETLYGYHIETFVIPGDSSASISLGRRIFDFSEKWAGKDNMRIYAYSGHASDDAQNEYKYHLGARVDTKGRLLGPTVDWFALIPFIESARDKADQDKGDGGDILYLLDACFGASAATYHGPEVLAAASLGGLAGAELETSFTKALICELRHLDGEPCSVAQLFASLHRNALAHQLSYGPVHVPRKGSSSVLLARVSKEAGQENEEPRLLRKRTRAQQKRKRNNQGGHESKGSRVLISVRLTNPTTTPSLKEWDRWLRTNIPANTLTTDITIQAVFEGSSLVLVTLPLELWTLLPADDESYSFVSFVDSDNILPALKEGAEDVASGPSVPVAGSENQPPATRRRQSPRLSPGDK